MRKYAPRVLLSLSVPGKIVVRLTNCLNMIIAVDWDVKPLTKHDHNALCKSCMLTPLALCMLGNFEPLWCSGQTVRLVNQGQLEPEVPSPASLVCWMRV